MIYVVGSGPAGVACAYALVKKGLNVTMLDAGIELEPEKVRVLERLQRSKQLDLHLVEKIKGNKQVTIKGVSQKLVYGSNYPYKEVNKHMPLSAEGIVANPSFAKGGLTTVWGAAVMPYLSDDIKDWPISIEDLSPYYTAVLDFMKIGVGKDSLKSLFPVYTKQAQYFQYSQQASMLLKDLEQNKEQLNTAGIYFGSSRLAVKFSHDKDNTGCIYCGLCLHGCPYKFIYNSAFTLEELNKYKNFNYKNNIIVEKVAEHKKDVEILAHHRITNRKIIFKGSKIFLACGAITTTRIMLESMNAYNEDVVLKDSQYFLFHLLRYRSAADVTKESLHTLAQLYIEIFDKKIDNNSVHLQLYTYSDLYETALKSMLKSMYGIFKKPLSALKSRLIIGQGYIHSNSSPTISVKLEKGAPGKLIMEKNEDKHISSKIKDVMEKLFENSRYIKAIPLTPILKIGKPGESNHLGGSFPMSKSPKIFQTDIYGRPFGYKHIHIVDATVFPSIPAQTITLTVMANAYRIADTFDVAERQKKKLFGK